MISGDGVLQISAQQFFIIKVLVSGMDVSVSCKCNCRCNVDFNICKSECIHDGMTESCLYHDRQLARINLHPIRIVLESGRNREAKVKSIYCVEIYIISLAHSAAGQD